MRQDPAAVTNVFKMAKSVAPSIIFFDDAETIFSKKAAKGVTLDIRAVKKDLAKNLKTLKPSDRVLLCARSTNPLAADATSIMSVFDCFAMVPRPSHTDRLHLWKKWLSSGQLNDSDLSLLAKLSSVFSMSEVTCLRRMIVLMNDIVGSYGM